jgi:hypothetical protein
VEALLIASPGSPDLLCLRGNCLAAVGNNVGVGAPARELLHAIRNSSIACQYKQWSPYVNRNAC